MVGNNVKKICSKKKITMYRVSKETGISQSYLSDLVNGKATNPSSEVLIKLSEFLNVPIDTLVK